VGDGGGKKGATDGREGEGLGDAVLHLVHEGGCVFLKMYV
jgi:hypothetical protein